MRRRLRYFTSTQTSGWRELYSGVGTIRAGRVLVSLGRGLPVRLPPTLFHTAFNLNMGSNFVVTSVHRLRLTLILSFPPNPALDFSVRPLSSSSPTRPVLGLARVPSSFLPRFPPFPSNPLARFRFYVLSSSIGPPLRCPLSPRIASGHANRCSLSRIPAVSPRATCCSSRLRLAQSILVSAIGRSAQHQSVCR
jgi:hypothetical protein